MSLILHAKMQRHAVPSGDLRQHRAKPGGQGIRVHRHRKRYAADTPFQLGIGLSLKQGHAASGLGQHLPGLGGTHRGGAAEKHPANLAL